MALSLKKDAYNKSISLSFNDLQKQLVDIKDIPWIKDVPSQSLQGAVQRLKRTYDNFFSKRAGFPKYQSKKKANSILFKSVEQLSSNTFKLPKIGAVKVYKDRQPEGQLKTATIVKDAGKYYLHIVCEIETKIATPCEKQVGIDVGVSNFAVLSDGTIVEHPQLLEQSKTKLRLAQRKLSRAKKRGKNRYKQVRIVQLLHQKVRRQRQDFIHKLSSKIVQENDCISVEKLNIKGMVQSNLSKQISDSGWGYFRQMLKYKAALYGKEYVEVNPKYSSQECFICGHISKSNRTTQANFSCENCGHTDHADKNASKNILRRGQRLLAQSKDNSLRLAKEPHGL